MELSCGTNVVVERPADGVWVARFTRPDMRPQLDGFGAEDCELYQDLQTAVLSRVAPGDLLVLNFGLVIYLPTAFYQVLLRLRQATRELDVRLALCGLTPQASEALQVMRADKLFNIVPNEDLAVRNQAR